MPIFPSPRVGGSDIPQLTGALAQWVTDNGGTVHPGLYIGSIAQYRAPGASDDGNWGGVMTQDVAQDEVLASIPVRLCLFPMERPPASGDQSDLFYQGVAGLVAGVAPIFWQLRLGLRLLAERAADKTFFSPYIAALPSQFSTNPLFFSKEAADSTGYRPFLTRLMQRSATLHALAKAVAVADPGASPSSLPPAVRYALAAFNGFSVTAGDLAWATAAVSSRAFQAPLPPSASARTTHGEQHGADAKCLIPLVDMLNHAHDHNARIAFSRDVSDPARAQAQGRDAYQVLIRATRPIKAGEEVTINYFKPQAGPGDAPSVENLLPGPANEHALADAVRAGGTVKEVFTAALARARGVQDYPEGLRSEVSTDDVLLNFGFVPPFNVSDSVSLVVDEETLALALEMSHDDTYPHAYLAMPAAELAERAQIVLPLRDSSTRRSEVLRAVLEQAGPLSISWRGPSDGLMRALRAAGLGAHPPRAAGAAACTSEEESAAVVGDEVAMAALADCAVLEDRARAVAATRGIVLPEDEPIDAALLAEGTRMPLGRVNEEAAMWALYSACIMASATFGSTLRDDVGRLTGAIRKRDSGEHTACLFARQKKLLLNHTLKTLATRLKVDARSGYAWHRNME